MLPIVAPAPDGSLELYFSPRDAHGRSRPARARLDLERRRVELEAEPLLPLGPLGAFDDRGVQPSCLVEAGGRHFLYYNGWTVGVTVPFYFFIGLAVSDDGARSFAKASPAPVVDRGPTDPFLSGSPWVLVEDGRFRMWYVTATGWEPRPDGPRHHYRVAYAESEDGVCWRRDGRVCIDFRDPDEYAISRPCVVRDAAGYRMWYACRGHAYRMGYAESADGLEWERRDEVAGITPSAAGWDSEMIAYPAVFDHGGARHMLYNGNGYGATGIGHAVLDSA